jgi:hypothetical protein
MQLSPQIPHSVGSTAPNGALEPWVREIASCREKDLNLRRQ